LALSLILDDVLLPFLAEKVAPNIESIFCFNLFLVLQVSKAELEYGEEQ